MPAAPGCGLQSNTACIPAGQYLRAGHEARKKRREERGKQTAVDGTVSLPAHMEAVVTASLS